MLSAHTHDRLSPKSASKTDSPYTHIYISPPSSGLRVPALLSSASASTAFDSLWDTIYSEVATLIGNNEAQHHFLVRANPDLVSDPV